MADLSYKPVKTSGFVVVISNQVGAELRFAVSGATELPEVTGDAELSSNFALVAHISRYGENTYAALRTRSPEKKKSHVKAADRHRKQALEMAEMIPLLTEQRITAWCSGCLERSPRACVSGRRRPVRVYLCGDCGTPTVECAVPRCHSHAILEPTAKVAIGYCAAHRHEIPSFEKLDATLRDLSEASEWLTFDHANAAGWTKVAGGALGVAVVVAPAALFAAPVLGAALGGSALGGGLSGAAATSHGLAMLGGGSLASNGLGMIGGKIIVTATGTALGGALGATTASAYAGSDKSFRIVRIQEGEGPAVVVASGFLTESDDDWGNWGPLIRKRFPGSPVYRLHWGSRELRDLAPFLGVAAGKTGARLALSRAAKRGSKTLGNLSGLGLVMAAHDLANNPWSLAKSRASMTGAVLADLISRTTEGRFILIGHSLGARVMVNAAQALGTRSASEKRIESMHLLGAAVGVRGDWAALDAAVDGQIWNYWSKNDDVLRRAYRLAQVGQRAVGHVGFNSAWPRIKDRNVTKSVSGHSGYLSGVTLA